MNTTPTLKRIVAGTLLAGGVAMGGFRAVRRHRPSRPVRLSRIPVLLLVPRKTPPQVGRAYHLGYECLPQFSLPDVWAWGALTAPCRLLPAKPAFGQLVRPVLSRGARPTPSR